jgi:hypothetical protein
MCGAGGHTHRVVRLVTRISQRLLGIRRVVDAHRRRRIGDAIVAGYRARPQRANEVGWTDDATIAMITAESW